MTQNIFVNPLQVPLGEGNGSGMVVSCFHSDITSSATTGTSQETLRDITLPAKSLTADGDFFEVHVCGQWDREQLSSLAVDVGGVDVATIYGGTGFVAGTNWAMDVRIWRNSSSTALVEVVMLQGFISEGPVPAISTNGLTHSSAGSLKIKAAVLNASYPVTVRASRGLHTHVPS